VPAAEEASLLLNICQIDVMHRICLLSSSPASGRKKKKSQGCFREILKLQTPRGWAGLATEADADWLRN
jgi:hypothetical protein